MRDSAILLDRPPEPEARSGEVGASTDTEFVIHTYSGSPVWPVQREPGMASTAGARYGQYCRILIKAL